MAGRHSDQPGDKPPVGAHPRIKSGAGSVRDALVAFRAKSFRAPPARESLSLCVLQEKVTKEKKYPAWRLPPIHGRQVRESEPGFANGHPADAKRNRHPCRFPLRGLSSPAHRRTGAPGRAACHLGPTRYATAARLRQQKAGGSGRLFKRGGSLLSAISG
jgi:hypothetical protein